MTGLGRAESAIAGQEHRSAGPPPLSARLAMAAATGAWFGLLGGLLEAGILGLKRVALGRLVFVPEFYWWAGPLVSAAMVAGVSVLTVAIWSSIWPRSERAVRVTVGVAFVAMTLILVVGGIAPWAGALLALGIGMRAGAWATARGTHLDRLVQRSVPVMLLAGPLLMTAAFRLRTPAIPVGEPPDGAPNVLLIVLDTVRALEMSLYGDQGHPATTPSIDAFAAGGVVFDRASSTAPWTGSSHASMFTGEWARLLSISWTRPLDNTYRTLAEELTQHGYHTGGFSANTEYAGRESGLSRGFQEYQDHRLSWARLPELTGVGHLATETLFRWRGHRRDIPGRVDAAANNARLIKWLTERPKDRPYFAFANYYDAHSPYYAPQSFWDRFLPNQPRTPLASDVRGRWRPADAEIRHRAYAASVASLDARLGELLDTLRVRGLLENTIVIITGDHGEEFAEHGVMGHGNSLYLPSVHVPLIVVGPRGVPPGCRVEVPVSNRRIPATIMDLVGLSNPFPGKSLRRTWADSASQSPGEPIITAVEHAENLPGRYPVSAGAVVAVQFGRYRLIRDARRTELFDVITDPMESADLAGDPAFQPTLLTLSRMVNSTSHRTTGLDQPPIDEAVAKHLGTFSRGCIRSPDEVGRLTH